MKNIYLTTTLVLLAISGILMAIGVRPVQHTPITKASFAPNQYVADVR